VKVYVIVEGLTKKERQDENFIKFEYEMLKLSTKC